MTSSANSAPATMKTMHDLAERLVANEAAAGTSSQASVPAAFRVCEKLRRPLTMLAGAAGFQSLLLRALMLAKREAPGLSTVRINADGSLESFPAPSPELERDKDKHDAEAGVVLVDHLLGLLFTFIGGTLTLHLLQDVWPDESSTTMLTAEGSARRRKA